MTVRRMSHQEVCDFFGSSREDGLLAEEGGLIVGVVGFNVYQGYFFVHSCFCPSWAYIGFHRRLIREAKQKGFSAFRFAIDHDNEAWLGHAANFHGVRPVTTVFQLEFK